MKSRFLLPVFAVLLTAAVSFGINALAATFTEPSGSPTSYNAPAPLDTSANVNQKIGGLILNTGGATNGLIVQSGNVGIGTTNPLGALQVNSGNILVTNTAPPSPTSGGVFFLDTTSAPSDAAQRLGVIVFGELNSASTFGNSVGIAGFSSQPWTLGSAQGSYLTFATTPNNTASRKEAMRIDQSGNVGIGTTNPGYNLDVNGTTNATQYCISGANCITAWPSGGTSQWTTSGNNIYNSNSGNVGIGTTNPKAKFSVGFNNDDELNVYSPSDNVLGIQTTLDGQGIGSYGGGNNVLSLQPSVGYVGIGMVNPQYKLDVAGAVHASGDVCTDQGGGKCLSSSGNFGGIYMEVGTGADTLPGGAGQCKYSNPLTGSCTCPSGDTVHMMWGFRDVGGAYYTGGLAYMYLCTNP